MKSNAIAVAALCLSNVVFAGTMGPVCSPDNVTVPCPKNAWDFGAQALYLKSLSNNNSWLSTINTGSASGTRIYQQYHRDFEWGFRLEGSYYFNTGNDIRVNWIWWKDGPSSRYDLTGLWALDTTATLIATGTSETKFNEVNAEFGQHVDFSRNADIRFHAGLQFAKIEFNSTDVSGLSGSVVFPEENYMSTTHSILKYEGVGPRVGADMTYNFSNSGFSIYGNVATALLIGTSKYADDSLYTATTRPVYSKFDALVPEIETKLGAKYALGLTQGTLILDAGYMVINYFSPLHSSNLDLIVGDETRNDVNFGLRGPYFGAKWIGSL
ncbi:MAG: Lpg1974 family pore-forming outer membrane protein [Legionella sp.]|uniref:Lpg1974 family pore-forming outer membrane protein n=1 Tax=Legionella sp. TaxID=459 RepID=UPI0039E32968